MRDGIDESAFRERMEQAALLPGHDPVRVALVQEIAAMGGEEGPAGREWLVLLEESERMKLGLLTVEMPADLEERLRRIPDLEQTSVLPWWKRPVTELVTLRRLAAAAAIVLIIGAGWWGVLAVGTYREGRTVSRLVSAAAGLHDTQRAAPAESIATSDPAVAEKWLQSRIQFKAYMLDGHGIKLTGASVVQFDSAPAALTSWQKDGHAYSLLEFVPGALGLPADFAKRTAEAARPGCKVVLWSEPNRGCGWALVMDSSAPNTFTY